MRIRVSFLAAPLFLFALLLAACSSSSEGTGGPGGTASGDCPDHCTPNPSRNDGCTASSHTVARYACTCDGKQEIFAGEKDLSCTTDHAAAGDGLCCTGKPGLKQPAGSGCNTAEDCAPVTCSCTGSSGSGCAAGKCMDSASFCHC